MKPPFELPEFIKVCIESVMALLPVFENNEIVHVCVKCLVKINKH